MQYLVAEMLDARAAVMIHRSLCRSEYSSHLEKDLTMDCELQAGASSTAFAQTAPHLGSLLLEMTGTAAAGTYEASVACERYRARKIPPRSAG